MISSISEMGEITSRKAEMISGISEMDELTSRKAEIISGISEMGEMTYLYLFPCLLANPGKNSVRFCLLLPVFLL